MIVTMASAGSVNAQDEMYLNSKKQLYDKLAREGIVEEVLNAMRKVPREEFLPEELKPYAYNDRALPIGLRQTISQPFVVAIMTQMLEVREGMKVLEIGTGSGYQAAILDAMGAKVYTIERIEKLLTQADERLKKLGYDDVETKFGDGFLGWPERAPFDRIIVTAGADELPEKLVKQLKIGGIMIIPVEVGIWGEEKLQKVTKTEDGVAVENDISVRFVPMLEGTIPDE